MASFEKIKKAAEAASRYGGHVIVMLHTSSRALSVIGESCSVKLLFFQRHALEYANLLPLAGRATKKGLGPGSMIPPGWPSKKDGGREVVLVTISG